MFRFLLALVIVIAIGAWYFGYLPPRNVQPVQTSDRPVVNTETARQRGAELGERAASAANEVAEKLDDAALIAKIKSKMALDDHVQARDINVDITNGVVTLSGWVTSEAERQRAVQLAKDTAGVKSVTDRLSSKQSP